MSYTPSVNADTLTLYLGICATGAAVAGSHTLSSVVFGTIYNPSSVTFTPDDVGMPIAIVGGGTVDSDMPPVYFVKGALFHTTIATYVSPSEVTLTDAPVTSISNTGFATVILYRPVPFASDVASVPTQFQFSSSIAPGTNDTLQFSILNSLGGTNNPYIDRFGAINLGQPVYLVSSDSAVGEIFGGYIDTLTSSSYPGVSEIYCWACQCASWSGLARRRVVPPAIPQTFTAVAGDQVFRLLVLDYLNDDGVAVTVTTAPAITLAAPVGANVGQLLDQVVSLISDATTAWYWTTNAWRTFILAKRTGTAAPWNITDGSDLFAGSTPYQQSIVQTHNQLANTVYALGQNTLLNALNATLNGNGTATTFNTPQPIGAAPTVTLNSASQTVGILGVDSGKNWYWSQGSTVLTQDASGTVLTPTDVLLVSYLTSTPAVAQSPNVGSLQSLQAIEGTSAIYGHSIAVSQPIMPDDLLAISTAYEIEYGTPASTCQFYTLRPGLATGQIQSINLAVAGVPSGDYLIASIQMSLMSNVIVWQYTAFGGANIGNSITALTQFINRGQATLSLLTPTIPITSSSTLSSPLAITIDHTQVTGPLTNFPLLFTGTFDGTSSTPNLKSVANGGGVTNSNGYDILFSPDSGAATLLDFEIDYYDATTGNCAFWVKIPTISDTEDTTIYLSWGNPTITTSQENIAGCWANGYVAVYHFGSHTTADSLAAHNLTLAGIGGVNWGAAGQIEDGLGFITTTVPNVSTPASSALTPDTLTISAWAYCTNFSSFGHEGCVAECYGSGSGWSLNVENTGKLHAFVGATGYDGTGTYTLSQSVWHLIGFSFAAVGNLIGYVDGAADNTQTAASYTHPTAAMTTLMSNNFGMFGHNDFNNGILDELHIANVTRSTIWMAAEYANQKTGQTFWSFSGTRPPAQTTNVLANPAGTVTHSAGALTVDQPVFGNGAGDIKVGMKTGSTDEVVTATGSATSGAPLLYDASGNAISGSLQGTGTQLQTATGSTTTGAPLLYDSSGRAISGAVGQLVPPGGTTGQVLAKQTGTDYDTEWESLGLGLGPVPAVVQAAAGAGITSLAFTSHVVAGNFSVVLIGLSGGTGTWAVTDTQGTSYTQIAAHTNPTVPTTATFYIGLIPSSGANTVAITGVSGGFAGPSICVMEVSGTTGVVDVISTGNGTAVPSITTTQPNDLIIAGISAPPNPQTFSATAPSVLDASDGGHAYAWPIGIGHLDTTTAGAYTPAISTTSTNAANICISLRASHGPTLPPGGTVGQVLTKLSSIDNDADWETPAATSPLTTKGDVFGFSSVAARVPVGSNGQVLTADSTQTLGVKWAAAGGGGGGGGGGFPFVIAQEASYSFGNASSFTATFPQSAAASGNTLFMLLGCDNTTSLTITGWTTLINQTMAPYARLMLVKIASAGQSSVTLTSSGTASLSIYFFEFAGSHSLDQVSSGGAADSVVLRLPSITPTAGSLVFGALGAVPANSNPGQWAASPVINPAWRIISVNSGRCLAFAVSNVSAVNVSTTPPALSFPDIGLYGGGFAYSTFSLL